MPYRAPILLNLFQLPVLMFCLLVLPSYGQTQATGFYEDAVARYGEGDYDAASIQLKNALQQDPSHLPSRLLLGEVNLYQGNPGGAEKELLIALRLGAAREKVYPSLGNALLLQRKYQQLLDTVNTLNSMTPEAEAVFVFRGWAHLEMAQLDAAQQSFERAGRISPDGVEVLLGKAAVLRTRSEFTAAEAIINQALALYEDHYEVWYQKGILRAAQGDETEALANFDRALEIRPENVRTLVSRGALYLRTGELEPAREDLAIVYEKTPNDFNAAFLYARVLGDLGDAQGRREVLSGLEDLLTRIREDIIMNEPSLLRTAALLKFMRDELDLASLYAGQYVKLKPNDLEMVKFLAGIRMKNGQVGLAMDMLYSTYRDHKNDPDILGMLGEAHLKKSQFAQAAPLLERAAELAPEDARIGTYLSLSKFGLGLPEAGKDELTKAFEKDSPDSTGAGVILARLQLRRGDVDAALETAQRLLTRQPRNPMLYNLIGAVYLKLEQPDVARKAFTQAGRVHPGFLGGEYNLALMDIREGDTESARKRLLALLQANQQSISVLLVLADLELSENKPGDAIPWLEKAAALELQTPEPGVRLVDLYIRTEKPNEALRVAENLMHTHAGNGYAMAALARAQSANNMSRQAVENYRRAVTHGDFKDSELLDIASSQLVLEDYDGARVALRKATGGEDKVRALVGLVRVEVAQENYAAAERLLGELHKAADGDAEAKLLLGDMRMQQGRYADAEKAYETSLQAEPGTLSALGIFKAVFLQGRRDEALDRLQAWTEKYPQDIVARRDLVKSRLSLGQLEQAKTELEKLIDEDYGDAYSFSQLARIYQLEKDRRAHDMAMVAVQMDPESADILDIYGWILVTDGKPEEGIDYLREAASRDNRPLIRYHLAAALSELGRKDEAKRELEYILRLKQEIPWLDTAQALYDSL